MLGSRAKRTWPLVVAIAALGCTGYPEPKPDRPEAPTDNDPAFTSNGLNRWYLAGDDATPAQDQVRFIITAPSGTDFVDVYIPGFPPQRMHHQSDGFAI